MNAHCFVEDRELFDENSLLETLRAISLHLDVEPAFADDEALDLLYFGYPHLECLLLICV